MDSLNAQIFVNPDAISACARAANITQDFALDRPMTMDLWHKLLNGEHSPIRELHLQIYLESVPYYAAMHLRTHQVALDMHDHPQPPRDWQVFVRSQRDDNYNPVSYDRKRSSQDAPVKMLISCNPQSLIDVSRKRLCGKADAVTLEIWESVKLAIANHKDRYVAVIANYMLPDCTYRGGVCHQGGCSRTRKNVTSSGAKCAELEGLVRNE